ncbi:MAG: hypothetical protein ABR570_16770 [Burkholderiales bacterium]
MVKPLAASLTVIAVLADEKAVELTATIRPPFEAEDGQWISRVQLKPLHKEPLDVRGVDSFHALWLACSLVLKLLSQLAAEGARLESADGSEFPLEAYLAGLTPKP